MRTLSPTRRARIARGFTLMEMIIVVILIAMISAVLVPRFGRTAKREFQFVAEQVTDMLTMFAQRSQMEQKPVGIMYDRERHWLMLVSLERDPERPEQSGEWLIDQYVQPIKLPLRIEPPIVEADGEYMDVSEWPLSTSPTEARPTVSITLLSDEQSATVTLPSYAIVPQQQGRTPTTRQYETIDLDSVGLGRENW